MLERDRIRRALTCRVSDAVAIIQRGDKKLDDPDKEKDVL